MDSWAIHYKNKYPGGRLLMMALCLDVFNAAGEHCVSLIHDPNGSWRDQSEKVGARDRHDLSPIPRCARFFKVKDNCHGHDEKAAERKAELSKFSADFVAGGKVLSIEELKAKGYEFDAKGDVTKSPAKALEPAPAQV